MSASDTFKCVGCGSCCSSYGYVYLTTLDRIRLSDHLGLSVNKFTDQYCEETGREYHLSNPHADCCFLSGNRCRVYDARPDQCRTWPDWPENFTGGKLKADAGAYCKGLHPDN